MSIPNRDYAYDGSAESTVSALGLLVLVLVRCGYVWWSVAGEKPILMHGPGLGAILVVHYRWPQRKATMDRTDRKAATKACCACCPFRSCAYCAPTPRPPMPIV